MPGQAIHSAFPLQSPCQALYYDMQSPTNAFDRLADVRAPLNAIMPSRPFAVWVIPAW